MATTSLPAPRAGGTTATPPLRGFGSSAADDTQTWAMATVERELGDDDPGHSCEKEVQSSRRSSRLPWVPSYLPPEPRGRRLGAGVAGGELGGGGQRVEAAQAAEATTTRFFKEGGEEEASDADIDEWLWWVWAGATLVQRAYRAHLARRGLDSEQLALRRSLARVEANLARVQLRRRREAATARRREAVARVEAGLAGARQRRVAAEVASEMRAAVSMQAAARRRAATDTVRALRLEAMRAELLGGIAARRGLAVALQPVARAWLAGRVAEARRRAATQLQAAARRRRAQVRWGGEPEWLSTAAAAHLACSRGASSLLTLARDDHRGSVWTWAAEGAEGWAEAAATAAAATAAAAAQAAAAATTTTGKEPRWAAVQAAAAAAAAAAEVAVVATAAAAAAAAGDAGFAATRAADGTQPQATATTDVLRCASDEATTKQMISGGPEGNFAAAQDTQTSGRSDDDDERGEWACGGAGGERAARATDREEEGEASDGAATAAEATAVAATAAAEEAAAAAAVAAAEEAAREQAQLVERQERELAALAAQAEVADGQAMCSQLTADLEEACARLEELRRRGADPRPPRWADISSPEFADPDRLEELLREREQGLVRAERLAEALQRRARQVAQSGAELRGGDGGRAAQLLDDARRWLWRSRNPDAPFDPWVYAWCHGVDVVLAGPPDGSAAERAGYEWHWVSCHVETQLLMGGFYDDVADAAGAGFRELAAETKRAIMGDIERRRGASGEPVRSMAPRVVGVGDPASWEEECDECEKENDAFSSHMGFFSPGLPIGPFGDGVGI